MVSRFPSWVKARRVRRAGRLCQAVARAPIGSTLGSVNDMLDIAAIRDRATRLSVADYHQLPERPVELLRGTLVDKMSKSPLHSATLGTLVRLLSPQIPAGWVLRQEGPLTFADSEPEPDLAVVAGTHEEYREHHPTTASLVIEVAVSSLEIDRVKALIYAEGGVPEYWIVRPAEELVEVYRHPTSAGYAETTIMKPPDRLSGADPMPLQLDLAALFGAPA